MDQELLLALCETLIKSGKEHALFILKKTIVDYEETVIDKQYFYGEVMTMLATDLSTSVVNDGDLGLEEALSELSCKKLDYIEELAENLAALYYKNVDIKEAIRKSIRKLCEYGYFRINNLIIRLAEKPELREGVVEELSNMGLYYYNDTLVDLVLEKGLFNNSVLDGLTEAVKGINFEAQIAFENLRYSDPLEISRTKHEIEKIKHKHKAVAQTIVKVFNHLGKRIKPNNKFFHKIICQNEDLNMDFYDLFANIDNYDTSSLDFIDLADCLSWGNTEAIVHLLIIMGKLPRENLGNMKSINKIVNNVFLEQIKDGVGAGLDKDENQFLEDVLESHAIYNLSATNLVKVVEYLYGDIKHIPSERVKEYRAEFEEHNPDNDGKLANEMFNVVKPITEVGHNEKNFFEELLIELLESKYAEHYEKSILRILDGSNALDMEFKTTSIRPYSELPYVICTYGSDEMIRLALKSHELPMYMFSDSGSTDLFKVYTRLGEYDKAMEILNDPFYELIDPGEEACLKEYCPYEMEHVDYYTDNISTIIQSLCYKKDINSLKFLNQVLHSPKLSLINVEVFERLNFFYRSVLNLEKDETDTILNQISEYLRQRMQSGELKLYIAVEDDITETKFGFTGLRLATGEEIESAFARLKPDNQAKKLIPPMN